MEALRPLAGSYLTRYLAQAPMALALERALECELYRHRSVARPVLDLGCGDGLFAEVLFGRGPHLCYGLDPDAGELRQARARAVYRRLLNARGDAIPLPTGSCATVLSNSVLEHIGPLDATLREVHRVLRQGGELLITVPTDRYERYCTHARAFERLGSPALAAAVRRRFNAFWRHHHALPAAGWQARLADAGFETIEIVEYAPARVCRLLSVLTPAAVPALVARRVLGRWTFIPRLRARVAPVLARALQDAMTARGPEGGLVFLRARA